MSEKKVSKKIVLLEKGRLPMRKDCHSGKSYEIVQSAKSAVSEGEHVVITVLKENGEIFDHGELTTEEKENTFGTLIEFLQREQPDGKWLIGLNGPGVTTRKTFHPHGIISRKKGQILRLVFNIREFFYKLAAARNIDEVQVLAEELEANLR